VCCTDEAEQAEALLMLTSILHFEQLRSDTDDATATGATDAGATGGGDGGGGDASGGGGSSEVVARVLHSLAMLHYLLRDNDKATTHSLAPYS